MSVLAAASSQIGAEKVDAVDVENVAIKATIENAEANGISDKINVKLGSVGEGEPFWGEQYDVVLANIISRILIELSEAIVAHTKPGGKMVLAGIIETREQDVIDAYAKAGARVINRRFAEDWVSLVLTRD